MMNRKPDYERKARVIRSGLCYKEKQVSRAFYANNQLMANGVVIHTTLSYDEARHIYYHETETNPEDWFEAKRVNHARYERNKRLENRIYDMLTKGKCIFLTLTFTDDYLNSTTADTRKQAVRRYLQSQSDEYIANIDFGKKNDREHYHAVILADKVDYEPWHRYGAIKGERVRYDPEAVGSDGTPLSAIRLSKYVSKLTNHAIKNTTKRNAIIYSRPKKKAD